MDLTRKRILYRSVNRGCKETDILVGRFMDANIESLSDEEVQLFVEFLEESDNDIYNWLAGISDTPEKYSGICKKMIDYRAEVWI